MKAFGPFRLDTVNFCLWRADERVPLTPKAFDVLRYLVDRADRLVTQEEILEGLWPGTYVNPEGVRKYILEIRKVLGDDPKRPMFIETLPKRGYQFVAEITEEQAVAPSEFASADAPFMAGRDAALAQLHSYLDAARSGQRRVVFVTGEAGIGKTTLVDMFQHQAARDPNLLLARGQSIEGFGGTEAYYPMLEAVGSLVRNANDDSLVQTLASLAPTWLAQFPSLVKAEERERLRREILGSTQGRMVREICEALEAICAKGPVIVILEDLHWADASTLDLISAFARRRDPVKLLLIGTYRPVDVVLSQSPLKGLKHDLLVRQLCHEIAVERLEEPDIAEYLANQFAGNDFPPELARLIHHNSGGNALFMVTIVQDIEKRGLIAKENAIWRLTVPVQDLCGIPETLQQMLELQFEQLSADERRILQSCSVAGERFSVWAATAMLDESPTRVEEICDRLARRHQFIRSAGIHQAADGTDSMHYEFRHALYRQALYRRLSSLNRSRLHRNLGERLMPICTAGKPELAPDIALHFEEGRLFEQAARCLMLVAANSARLMAYRDSLRGLEHALELAQLTAGDSRIPLEIEILQRIGDASYALGAMSESAAAYETAAARAAEADLRRAQVDALARLAFPIWGSDPERGNQICEQAIEISRLHGDPLLLAQSELAAACFRLIYDCWRKEDADTCESAHQAICRLGGPDTPAHVYHVCVLAIQGHYEESLRQADAVMMTTDSPAAYLLAFGAKTLSLVSLGRFGDVMRIVCTGRELTEKHGEEPWLFLFREAWLRQLCFDHEGVVQLSQVVMRTDAEQHSGQPRTMAMVACGYAELYRGRWKEALEYFARVRDPEETPRFFLHWRWRMRAQLGAVDAFLEGGEIENARREADSFMDAALSTGEPNLHAFAWEARARVAIAEDDRERALQCMESALEVLDRYDIPVVAWRVHATAWDVYRYVGLHEKAEAHRTRAGEVIMKIADSFEAGEPLRESLLSAPPLRAIFRQSASA
jgi:DNA-binding winged helix-turn-helix (wHTH) protein/tetratricopeptide (TPR) repeat protein